MSAEAMVSVGALLTAVATLVWTGIRARSDADNKDTDTRLRLSERLQEVEAALDEERETRRAVEREIESLSRQVAKSEREMTEVKGLLVVYEGGVRTLIRQIEAAGMSAEWRPPDFPRYGEPLSAPV